MILQNTCLVADLGCRAYPEIWDLQKALHALRVSKDIGDVLLILEHFPTLTIGKSGSRENILVPLERLAESGISLFHVERGGDVTYHGPGQLVGYPIMDLGRRGKNIWQFVTDLEETLIRTARDFSIAGGRDPGGHRGVWVGDKELAAIGLSVRKWVSMHGFALNVTTNLDHFRLINPCGLHDRQATSMAECLGVSVAMAAVRESLLANFAIVFGVELIQVKEEELLSLIAAT